MNLTRDLTGRAKGRFTLLNECNLSQGRGELPNNRNVSPIAMTHRPNRKGWTMLVQDVIKTKGNRLITVTEDASIKDAAKLMGSHHIGALVVLASDGRVRGIMSEREIVSALARCGKGALELYVRELTMLAGPVVSPAESILNAMEIMTERRARHLPVILDHSVIGILSIGDVVKARLTEKINENLVLQEIAGWHRAAAA
jgi:CBS domain-containing protein